MFRDQSIECLRVQNVEMHQLMRFMGTRTGRAFLEGEGREEMALSLSQRSWLVSRAGSGTNAVARMSLHADLPTCLAGA